MYKCPLPSFFETGKQIVWNGTKVDKAVSKFVSGLCEANSARLPAAPVHPIYDWPHSHHVASSQVTRMFM